MLNPQFLSDALSAVCPIDGLAILSLDPPMVRIDARPDATAEQIVAANAVVDGWDWSDEAEAAREAAAVKAAAVEHINDPDPPGIALGEGLRLATEAIQWNAKVADTILAILVAGADATTQATIAATVGQLAATCSPPVKASQAALELQFPFAAVPFEAAKQIAKARLEQ